MFTSSWWNILRSAIRTYTICESLLISPFTSFLVILVFVDGYAFILRDIYCFDQCFFFCLLLRWYHLVLYTIDISTYIRSIYALIDLHVQRRRLKTSFHRYHFDVVACSSILDYFNGICRYISFLLIVSLPLFSFPIVVLFYSRRILSF